MTFELFKTSNTTVIYYLVQFQEWILPLLRFFLRIARLRNQIQLRSGSNRQTFVMFHTFELLGRFRISPLLVALALVALKHQQHVSIVIQTNVLGAYLAQHIVNPVLIVLVRTRFHSERVPCFPISYAVSFADSDVGKLKIYGVLVFV